MADTNPSEPLEKDSGIHSGARRHDRALAEEEKKPERKDWWDKVSTLSTILSTILLRAFYANSRALDLAKSAAQPS